MTCSCEHSNERSGSIKCVEILDYLVIHKRSIIHKDFAPFNFLGWVGILWTVSQRSSTVHRPGDDPRKEGEECGNARGSNVRYYPT
jgi:hypothetical protein